MALAETEAGLLREVYEPPVWLSVLKGGQVYEFETDGRTWVRHRGELCGPHDPLPCGGRGAHIICLGGRHLQRLAGGEGPMLPLPDTQRAVEAVASAMGDRSL